ncbi:hypothetical protein GF373_08645 [bacterium]|nr:hypothetical protein [bacterium]
MGVGSYLIESQNWKGLNIMNKVTSRRSFLRTGTATALTAASWNRVVGANERIHLGMIGYGLIGSQHVHDFKGLQDVEIVGLSDAHAGRLAEGVEHVGGRVKPYADFRDLLNSKTIDAVCVSTPDHWHALMTMMACEAGKDVYVEKPLTRFIREGDWMQAVAKRTQRVVQVGTQQRSGGHYQRARALIQSGALGEIVMAQINMVRNLMPGLGSPPNQSPPPALDWDMFTGPAEMKPYNPNWGIYQFRWSWDYSGGQTTNWGAHSMDIIQWFLEPKGPSRVSSIGGRRFLEDNCETPDMQNSILDYNSFTVNMVFRDCSQGHLTGTLVFYGTKGSLKINRGMFEVHPDRQIDPFARLPFGEEVPVGAPKQPPKDPDPPLRTEKVVDRSGHGKTQLRKHARNFIDCVKSRQQPISDLGSACRVNAALHLANISLRLNREVVWDADRGDVVNDADASRLIKQDYREPWDRVLKTLKVL